MLFVGGVTTCFAYWLWGRLLRDHPAAQVVPFALLVPFVGSAASSIVFGEKFGALAARRHGHGDRRHRHHVAFKASASVPEVPREPDHVASASVRLCRVRHRDVLHARSEQHHAAVVGVDLRLPADRAAYLGHHLRFCLHGRRGGRRPRHRLPRLSDPADHPEMGRRRLSRLSRRRDRACPIRSSRRRAAAARGR